MPPISMEQIPSIFRPSSASSACTEATIGRFMRSAAAIRALLMDPSCCEFPMGELPKRGLGNPAFGWEASPRQNRLQLLTKRALDRERTFGIGAVEVEPMECEQPA